MSPFMNAEKINEPLLLIHGEVDNNSGTFPIQSKRLYGAVGGLGGTIKLVMLPHESHGYAARESLLHMLYEQTEWLNTYVRNAKPKELEDFTNYRLKTYIFCEEIISNDKAVNWKKSIQQLIYKCSLE